ncbi:hypothetical protein JCM16358_25800 [Halanaerocella petrolearia]
MEINRLSTLKQYNLNNDKMSNSIPKNIDKLNFKSITISSLLQNLSLNTTEYNKMIATELLKANLPLNKELMTTISQFLQNTEDEISATTKEKIQVAILLKQLQLPLKTKYFHLIKEYNSSSKELKQILNQLFHQDKSKLNSQTNNSNNLKSDLQKLIQQFKIPIQNKEDKLVTIFKKIITTLENKPKPNLTSQLTKIIKKHPNILTRLKKGSSKAKFGKLDKLIKSSINDNNLLAKYKLLTTVITPNNTTPDQVKQGLTTINFNPGQKKLIELLSNLETNKQEGDKFIHKLISLKAMNYETNLLQLVLPIMIKDAFSLVQIEIKDDQQQKKEKNKSDLEFSIALETEKLGDIRIKVKIQNSQLNLLFLTDNSETEELIQTQLTDLATKLKDTGYQLNYCNCKLADQKLTNSNKKEIKLTNIDFTI